MMKNYCTRYSQNCGRFGSCLQSYILFQSLFFLSSLSSFLQEFICNMDHNHHLYHNGIPDLTRWIPGGSNYSQNNPTFEQAEGDMKSRWARQETLTLLEIRSHLHRAFKDSNLKAPLWDQVSRIMRDEHGYNRSGKKCKEKFENLYKYYKKTKECNMGRQDGKNYRFFRQLEAICGDSINQYNSKSHTRRTNQPNPIELNASLTESKNYELGDIEKIIELRMGSLMERQDFWMEKIIDNFEYKELVSASKHEEWRKQEATRFDEEYEILAKERTFHKARDTELLLTLQTLAPIDT